MDQESGKKAKEKKPGRPRKISRVSRRMLMDLYQDSCFPVFLVDRRMEVFYANSFAREHYPSMCLPDGFSTMLAADTVETCMARIGAGESFRVDLPLLRVTRASLACSPIREEDGEITGAVLFMTSIMDRMLPGMDVATDIGSTAIYSALHNPTDDISGSLYVLGQRMSSNGDLTRDDKGYETYLNTINRANYQIMRACRNMAYFLNSCSDHRPRREVVDFWLRMHELLEGCRVSLHGQPTAFQYQLPESCAKVSCCFEELAFALMNLLQNAFHCTAPEGTVTVKGFDTAEGVRVEVIDTGRGIPLEEQERVFTPFYSRGAGGEPLVGMGLGLTVVRQIVRNNGGTVVMSSVPGQGTTMAFSLPICDEPIAPRSAMESGSAPYLRMRYSPIYVGLCDIVTLPTQY